MGPGENKLARLVCSRPFCVLLVSVLIYIPLGREHDEVLDSCSPAAQTSKRAARLART